MVLFTTLMPGFRDLRAALIAGSLLVESLYLILGNHLPSTAQFRPELLSIIRLDGTMPAILAILTSALVGSLYTTALEGLVDWLHRRLLHVDLRVVEHAMLQRVLGALIPFSSSSRRRATLEAKRFYDDVRPDGTAAERDQFENQVLGDILWLEGKLVETPLKDPHDQYRSEGELRLATGLLLPLVSAAIFHGVNAPIVSLVLAIAIGLGLGIWQVNYGLYYFKRANSFLAHHIADGDLMTPTMETLQRADLAKRRTNPIDD